MKFEYTLSQLHPQIFILETNSIYDLGMLFLRAQEFYESANPMFRGKEFTLLSYMDWYAKGYSKEPEFAYSNDFRGFNVPSSAIVKCYSTHTERTPYDKLFIDINQHILDLGVIKYYMIGVNNHDNDALDHELAHALFYLDDKYRETMTQLVEMLPFKDNLFVLFEKELAYAKEVHIDEGQAYMATGLVEELDEIQKGVQDFNQYTEPFKKVFAEWRVEINAPITLVHRTVDFFDNVHI